MRRCMLFAIHVHMRERARAFESGREPCDVLVEPEPELRERTLAPVFSRILDFLCGAETLDQALSYPFMDSMCDVYKLLRSEP